MYRDGMLNIDRNRIERLLFPRHQLFNFLSIIGVSAAFSFILTGKQILQANWGLIDDHEVFRFLGPALRLPASDIWNTLLTKTEVGQIQGRFRPAYYAVKLLETSLFGANAHLWYAWNTVAFTIFLGSIWWSMSRVMGTWLSGVLTASIALLPMWAGVWARLGPSEIYGAACVGLMLFAADAILHSGSVAARNAAAIVLTLVAIILAGMKETFLPLAVGGVGFVLVLAAVRERLAVRLIAILGVLILICVAAIGVVVLKEVHAAGVDFYGNPLGAWSVLKFTTRGAFDAMLRTWWIWVLPLIILQLLNVIPRKPLGQWIASAPIAAALYAFFVAMYAAQCGLYRMLPPFNSRYDFPAMLLVPLTCCVLACVVASRLRNVFPERVMNYAELSAAFFLIFALGYNVARPPALPLAVKQNILTTNLFFDEVQRAVGAAKQTPDRPIILEAHGPGAYEAIFSISTYLRALGAQNAISVRYHSDARATGSFYEGLGQTLMNLQNSSADGLTPLADSLARLPAGCLSIGIDGPSDTSCSGFRINDTY